MAEFRVLTEETYNEVERVIGLAMPGLSGGTASGGGNRQVTFVKITSGTSNPYTGTVYYMDSSGTLIAFDDDVRLREISGAKLVSGSYYPAVRTGADGSGKAVYLTALPITPCTNTLTVHTGTPTLSYSGHTLTLTIPTKDYQLQIDSATGKLCMIQTGSGTVTATVNFPCETVVTNVSCVSGSLSVTTGTAVGCS